MVLLDYSPRLVVGVILLLTNAIQAKNQTTYSTNSIDTPCMPAGGIVRH
jgi:hypothetical protein